jgi:hypothetical protein
MDSDYRDRWIACTPNAIEIRGYYLPWGTKRIRYSSIRSVRRVRMGAFTGKGRIWGTANPRYWASLDPRRPRKDVALVLDLGRFVRPVVTPDDPDAVETAIREHGGPTATVEGGRRGPVL